MGRIIIQAPDQQTGKLWKREHRYCDRIQSTTACDFLLGAEPVVLPDHVCPTIYPQSTAQLAIDCWGCLVMGDAWEQWSNMLTRWPLPAGRQTIRSYARSRGEPPEALPQPLPPPIVTMRDDCWIGLAVTRRLDEGMVRLLGIVATDDQEWFTFTDLLTQTERSTPKSDRGDPLDKIERELRRWYRKHMLGQRVAGRTAGTTDYSQEKANDAYMAAIKRLRRDGITPTFVLVAQYMSYSHVGGLPISPQTVWNYIDRGVLPRWETLI